MQQMYAHYINQYMQYLQSAGTPFAAAGFHHWNPAMAPTMVHDPRQAEAAAAAANNVLEPIAAAAAAAVAGGQAVAAAGHHAAAPAVGANGPPAAHVPAAAPAADVGPNPPNVVLNANAGGLGAIEDDDDGLGGQRDILDWFYVLSRVLVLFSIVYFYSSLARFALVAGFCVVLYLYQLGFFGQPRGAAANNNNNLGAARPPQQQQPQPQQNQEQDLIRQQVDQVRQAAGGGAEDEAHQLQQQPEVVAPESVPPNYFSVAATFVTAFFSSLIPHEPQVV